MRWVTCQENNLNTPIRGKSKYRGVSFFKRDNKWQAKIKIDGKSKHLGLYETEIDAARAYNNYILSNNMNSFYLDNLNTYQNESLFEVIVL